VFATGYSSSKCALGHLFSESSYFRLAAISQSNLNQWLQFPNHLTIKIYRDWRRLQLYGDNNWSEFEDLIDVFLPVGLLRILIGVTPITNITTIYNTSSISCILAYYVLLDHKLFYCITAYIKYYTSRNTTKVNILKFNSFQ